MTSLDARDVKSISRRASIEGDTRVEEEEEVIDVLDLPQLYTRPSAEILLATLADLSTEPPSWEANGHDPKTTSEPPRRRRKVRGEGVPQYLTRIIASPLTWIADDDAKERVWEGAAQRLSERSGRTAMGDLTRTFRIPIRDQDRSMEIRLHEPALTADNLGLKTWASSFLLAKRLEQLRDGLLAHLTSCAILELGAGTGLVGMTAAAIFRTLVILTDLPEIVPNLDRNAKANAEEIQVHGGRVVAAALDWSCPDKFVLEEAPDVQTGAFSLIVVADPIYSSDHPCLLVQAIKCHLASKPEARVVIELPLRETYIAEREDLHNRLQKLGLEVIAQGEEVGFDDWSQGRSGDDLAEVRCGWSVWAWQDRI